MKHRYASVITGSALILSVALAPGISLAASYDQGNRGQQQEGQQKAQKAQSFFANFANWFKPKTAYAQNTTPPTTPPAATSTPQNKAPSISGISAPTTLKAGATGTWSVSASDPENGSLSYAVDWGDQGQGMKSLAALESETFVQTSSFTHMYEMPGTYTVRFVVKDDGGKTSASSVTVRVSGEAAPALTISGVSATSTSQTHATISWTTNLRSNSKVMYGTSTPVSASSALSASAEARVLNHQITLNKLTAGTTYYFVVQSTDAKGAVVTSSESSFTTPAPANGAPSVKSIEGPQTVAVDTEGTWTVHASDPENSSLSYSIDWGDTGAAAKLMAFFAGPAFTQTSTFSHTCGAAGTYTITVTVQDEAGLSAKSTTTVMVTAATPSAPILSNLTALVGGKSIVFNWTTDVAANAEVYYSSSSPVVIGGAGTIPVLDATLGTNHSLTVSNLLAGTPYYFLIRSKDSGGATSSTHEFSLTTMGM